MSDGSITVIASTVVTVVTLIIGLLTLWIKLKYGVDKVQEVSENAQKAALAAKEVATNIENKIDENTAVTVEAKEAAARAGKHTDRCDEERSKILKTLSDTVEMVKRHDARISAVEAQVSATKASVDNVSKSVDSTRDELRGHMQILANKLDLMTAQKTQGS